MSELSLRQQLVDTSVKLVKLGLNRGTSGNVSIRLNGGFLVTPSGMPAGKMSSIDMVEMDFSGQVIGAGKPSSEWRFHRDILAARDDVNAIIHVHSMYATTLACVHKDIPPFHYMISVAGGDTIRCAPYALFGSQVLSDNALAALDDRNACLLANHGMIVLGRNIDHALSIAVEVEMLCEQYCHALKLGNPVLLTPKQMQEVHEQLKGYGNWEQNKK